MNKLFIVCVFSLFLLSCENKKPEPTKPSRLDSLITYKLSKVDSLNKYWLEPQK